jgi:hypothetical protein
VKVIVPWVVLYVIVLFADYDSLHVVPVTVFLFLVDSQMHVIVT